MKRIAILTFLATGLLTGAALAQAPEPGGPVPVGGLVQGGAFAKLSGGGEDAKVTYATGGAGAGIAEHLQPGRAGRFVGSDGDGRPRFEYGAAPAMTQGAGREAWLSGSGDDAQVAYSRSH